MIDRITSTLQEQPDLSRLWSDPRPLVVLMALRQAGGPLYASQIARQLGAHQETVTKKLRSLRAMGMVTRPGVRSGWCLTASGLLFVQGDGLQGINAALPPDEADEAELSRLLDSFCGVAAALDEAARGEGEEACARAAPVDSDEAENQPARREDEAENPPFGQADNADSGENPRLESVKTLEEESLDSLDSLDSSSSVLTTSDLSDSEGENRISMTELLAHSARLFGEPGVLSNQLPERPPRLVLGWLAQAYAQRRTLRNPAGLVYRRLQRGDEPQQRYREQAEKYLPPAYLAAIGRVGYIQVDAEDASDPGGEYAPGAKGTSGAKDAPDEEQVDASLLSEVNGRTALEAWEQALRLLQGELSTGSYQTYLTGVRPQRWEAEGRLVVAAPTPYARDWLRERAGKTLERMLCGILNRTVRVVFESTHAPSSPPEPMP